MPADDELERIDLFASILFRMAGITSCFPPPSSTPAKWVTSNRFFPADFQKKKKQETMGQHGTRQRDMYKARTATFQPKLQGYRNCSIRP